MKQQLSKEIDRLAREAGYPHIKLDHHTYMKVLKQAHDNIYKPDTPVIDQEGVSKDGGFKVGEVIRLDSELISFRWNDGLHIVMNVDKELITICRLDERGMPQKYDDGRYMCSVTGVNNKGITKTNLTFRLDPGFKFL